MNEDYIKKIEVLAEKFKTDIKTIQYIRKASVILKIKREPLVQRQKDKLDKTILAIQRIPTYRKDIIEMMQKGIARRTKIKNLLESIDDKEFKTITK